MMQVPTLFPLILFLLFVRWWISMRVSVYCKGLKIKLWLILDIPLLLIVDWDVSSGVVTLSDMISVDINDIFLLWERFELFYLDCWTLVLYQCFRVEYNLVSVDFWDIMLFLVIKFIHTHSYHLLALWKIIFWERMMWNDLYTQLESVLSGFFWFITCMSDEKMFEVDFTNFDLHAWWKIISGGPMGKDWG